MGMRNGKPLLRAGEAANLGPDEGDGVPNDEWVHECDNVLFEATDNFQRMWRA